VMIMNAMTGLSGPRCQMMWLLSWLLTRCSLVDGVGQDQSSVLCVVLATPGTYEPHLLAGQYVLKAGIFQCDDFAIVTNVTAAELFADHVDLIEELTPKVWTIGTSLWVPQVAGPPGFDPSSPKEFGEKGAKHLANTPVFLRFWKAVEATGLYKKYDYTVKVDADTVLLPQRLSGFLTGRPKKPEYFLNVDKDMYGNFLHGPIEILSSEAMDVFAKRHKECEAAIPKLAYGEDFWLNKCLQHLKVTAVPGLNLLYDKYAWGPWAQNHCDGLAPEAWKNPALIYYASYHPHKTFKGWMKCLLQAHDGEVPGKKVQQQAMGEQALRAPAPQHSERLFRSFRVKADGGSSAQIGAILVACSLAVSLLAWSFSCRRASPLEEHDVELETHMVQVHRPMNAMWLFSPRGRDTSRQMSWSQLEQQL